LIKFTAIYCFL